MNRKRGQATMNRRDFFRASVVTAGAAVSLAESGGNLEETAAERSRELAALGQEDVRVLPNRITPHRCVVHDPNVCVGCNTCVTLCHADAMIPNPKKGKPPVMVWPDECWLCGVCVKNCPLGLEAKAIRLIQPMGRRVRWKRKATGEHMRIGMPNPPAPNKKLPIGGYFPHS